MVPATAPNLTASTPLVLLSSATGASTPLESNASPLRQRRRQRRHPYHTNRSRRRHAHDELRLSKPHDGLDLGVRGFDTSARVRRCPAKGGWRGGACGGRDRHRQALRYFRHEQDPVLSAWAFTKTTLATCNPLTGYKNSTKAIEHDFAVLGLDYVDLLLLHWPCDDFEDSVTAYKAMEPYVKSGKVRAIGISNFNASAITALLPRVSIKPAMNQCAFSIAGHSDDLWGRDDATREACKANNMAYAAYSPLGGWAKHGTGHVLNDPTVKAVAAAHNVSAAQVALRWVTQQGVVAVTSSDNPAHVMGDVASFEFELTEEEVEKLAKVQ